jgi:exonuclease III
MFVLTWNIQGAWPGAPKERVRNQIEFIDRYDDPPDILLLQEVSRYRPEIRKYLNAIGYHTIEDTLDWATELSESTVQPHQDISHTNGNLTAVRGDATLTRKPMGILEDDYEDEDVKNLDTHYPEKILVADCEIGGRTIECWNVRAVPGSMKGEEKIKILESVFHRIMDGEEKLRILAGDFNTPYEELCDGQAVTHLQDKDARIRHRWHNAELNILKGLGHAGMIDTFRAIHGFGDLNELDVSHATRTDDPLKVPVGQVEGMRFDHIFASSDLGLVDSFYDVEGFRHSDHAPLLAEFEW